MNCATIVRKDQEASNGVVHIVDTLLDPERSTYSDLAAAVVQVDLLRLPELLVKL